LKECKQLSLASALPIIKEPMARLSDRIENALNETRMLLLGGQVLVGFSYRICFEERFTQISASARLAEVTGLGLMTAGLGWLIWPAAFHQIVERGEESAATHNFATRILDWALLPFALGLGLILFPVCVALQVPYAGMIAAIAGGFALVMWYIWGVIGSDSASRREAQKNSRHEKEEKDDEKKTEISNKIKKLLIECRMALPGAQAFLGFQFAIVFASSFANLPRSSHWIHFASLMATTVSIVLLIAPAAYHRLVEAGEDTEHFYEVGSRFLLAALIFLPPGMTGDLLVVMRQVTGSLSIAVWVAALLLVAFYGLWFGVSLWRRRQG
jgi:Family of unknown function (DUF6328)